MQPLLVEVGSMPLCQFPGMWLGLRCLLKPKLWCLAESGGSVDISSRSCGRPKSPNPKLAQNHTFTAAAATAPGWGIHKEGKVRDV